MSDMRWTANGCPDCLSDCARRWFSARFGEPTTAQRLAWPMVAQGDSVLICTPTGTGKTLAGMLPILDRLHAEQPTGLQVVYVAPLKALVQDACTMLRRHAQEMKQEMMPDAPPLRIALRTGDTSARARKFQLDEPPQILLTTPESLAVLLTHPRSPDLFRTLRWAVVDELHALACNKRGADLALSLERIEVLCDLAGGMRRIGLSATCTPLSTAARFLTGVDRPCRIVRVNDPSDMDLRVEPLAYEEGPGFLNRLLGRLDGELAVNRTTLIFTNTRSLTERVTWALRHRYPRRAEDIAAHHSALAPARRRLVERAMKQGRLWAAVSSTSLELGIDIGSVDSVVFVHPPGSVVRLLQRLGRSGHRPGVPRRGLVLTASARELLEATVTADCGRHGQIEVLEVPEHPFDVVCQHLAGMAITAAWTVDEAYALVRRAYPYRALSRDDFDACLDYLSGRHPDGTEWLPPRLGWRGDAFTILNERTARLMRRNLGTILTEDPCAVRMPLDQSDSGVEPRTSLVGELDELYAERLQPGDRFMLDGRCLEYQRRDGTALLVDEVVGRPQVPRWRGAGPPMSNELASRLYLFRVQAAEALRDSPARLERLLRWEFRLDAPSADSLGRYVMRQETLSEVPGFDVLLIERLSQQACTEYYFHTPLATPANEAIVRVVAGRITRLGLGTPVSMAADLGFVLVLENAADVAPAVWRRLLTAEGFTDDFRSALAESPLLRERFAQVAQTGLMLLRHPAGRKLKVGGASWAREQLFDQVRTIARNFPLLRQAEAEAATLACDVTTAHAFIRRLSRMHIRLRSLAEPSPFADSLLAGQSGPVETSWNADDALLHLQNDLLQAQGAAV
jgi:ATP-dependent helicase Lhr and Lhr-like helicase